MSMYSAGIRNERVSVLWPRGAVDGAYGRRSGGVVYDLKCTLWAAVDFVRGVKALQAGAVEVYDTLMVRMQWSGKVRRDSVIVWRGRAYLIMSLNGNRLANTMQLTVREMTSGASRLDVRVWLKDKDGVSLRDADGRLLTARADIVFKDF